MMELMDRNTANRITVKSMHQKSLCFTRKDRVLSVSANVGCLQLWASAPRGPRPPV